MVRRVRGLADIHLDCHFSEAKAEQFIEALDARNLPLNAMSDTQLLDEIAAYYDNLDA